MNRRMFSPQTNLFSFSYILIKSQIPDTPFSVKRTIGRKRNPSHSHRHPHPPWPRRSLGEDGSRHAIASATAGLPRCSLGKDGPAPRSSQRSGVESPIHCEKLLPWQFSILCVLGDRCVRHWRELRLSLRVLSFGPQHLPSGSIYVSTF